MIATSVSRSLLHKKRLLIGLVVGVACLFLLFADRFAAGSHATRHRSQADDVAQRAQVADEETRLTEGSKDDFDPTHQKSAPKLSREPTSNQQCDGIPSWYLHDLATEYGRRSPAPKISHFHDGRIISDEHQTFDIDDEFCSVIFAPQNPRANKTEFQNQPIEGWGPDSIHAEMQSDDIRLVFVQHPDYWGMFSVTPQGMTPSAQNDTIWAVYTVPYSLRHPGSYQASGEVEFQNYDWVMEDPIDLQTERLPYVMLNNTLEVSSPPVVITGRPVSRPTAKCHYNGMNNLRGRWYRASSFALHGNQTALNPDAYLEFAEHNTTTDEWGWTFAPDLCSLTYFSPEDHLDCLGNRSIQVLGDSNSRRVLKSVASGGIAWCQERDERICQCEDHFQEEFYDVLWNKIDAFRIRDTTQRDEPTIFGRNSKLYFDFVGGAINAKLFNPWEFFYNENSDQQSIVSRRMENYGPIDVVHVSFIGWDMAAVLTPSEMVAALPKVRETLRKAYPAGTRFIHRLANNNCCGNTNHKTRYSAPRFAIWNHMWREFWAEDEKKGTIKVIDPSVLQGRRDAETAFLCPTTHLRASHVRLEQMMWMGAVCEKVDGTARIRNW